MASSLPASGLGNGYNNRDLPISGPAYGIKRSADSPGNTSVPPDPKRPKFDGSPVAPVNAAGSSVAQAGQSAHSATTTAPPQAVLADVKSENAPLRIFIRPNVSNSTAGNGSGPSSAASTPGLSSTQSQSSSHPHLQPHPQPQPQPQPRKRPIQIHNANSTSNGSSTSAVTHRVNPQTLTNSGIDAKDIGPYTPIPGRQLELQDGRCLKRDYLAASRCTACVNKQARTDCLFHGFRVFVLPEPPYNAIAEDTPTFFATFSTPTVPLSFPDTFNRPYTAADQRVLSVSAAQALMPTIERSLQHAGLPNAVRRPSDHRDRHVCDFCLTSFFFSYWFCGECGREYCEDCLESIKKFLPSVGKPLHATDPQTAVAKANKAEEEAEKSASATDQPQQGPAIPYARHVKTTNGSGGGRLTNISSHSAEDYARLPPDVDVSKGRISDARTRRMLGCCGGRLHGVDFMIPVTTKSKKDLEVLREQMRADILSVRQESLFEDTSKQKGISAEDRSTIRLGCDSRPEWDPIRPLIIEGLHQKMDIDWSPASFASAFQKMNCEIQECFSGLIRKSKVSDFFCTFGKKRSAQDGIWKLKDWPPTADFATWQPDLFEEFMKVVPFPDITRHDGVRNFGVRFPQKSNRPDLGPKLYCAQSSIDAAGYGTTKLHIDAADAINIMVHCGPDYSKSDEGVPGEALWTIYAPQSSHIVREFCYEILAKLESRPGKEKTVEDVKKYLDDPIHMQQMYLDESMRRELEHRGARAWSIRQRVGEAVTIPAGCAHQVCNLGDCIKIAVDFVSPESVKRCWQTSSEFRQLTKVRAWKEDLLQLKNMIYYTWLACPPPSQIRQESKRVQDQPPAALANGHATNGSVPSPAVTNNQPLTSSLTRAAPVATSTPSTISLPRIPTYARTTSPGNRLLPTARTTSPIVPSAPQPVPSALSPAAAPPPAAVAVAVESKAPLPRLRGRSPSEIVPVLKPGTSTSSVRTRPASTLEPLEKPPSTVAEPGVPLMLPLDRPESLRSRPAVQQSTWSAFYTRGDAPPELRRDTRGTTDAAFFKHLYG